MLLNELHPVKKLCSSSNSLSSLSLRRSASVYIEASCPQKRKTMSLYNSSKHPVDTLRRPPKDPSAVSLQEIGQATLNTVSFKPSTYKFQITRRTLFPNGLTLNQIHTDLTLHRATLPVQLLEVIL